MRALLDLATTSGTTRAGGAPHRVTEPDLAMLRRVLPPVRLAGVILDLSVPAVLLGLLLLQGALP